MKILIADDDLFYRILIKEVVQGLGHYPIVVDRGDKALAKLQRDKSIQIAIIDIFMEGIDGLELINKINTPTYENEVPAKIFFIVITGDSSLKTEQDARKYPLCRFLLKPLDKKELSDAIETAEELINRQFIKT